MNSTLGTDGLVITTEIDTLAIIHTGRARAVQPNGRIIVGRAIQTNTDSPADAILVRYCGNRYR